MNLRVKDGPGDTRFLSGGGYRYDYWRVAWLEFKDAPLRGQGAGNYDDLYFVERRTSEDIRQPHSLQMQTLAELGLVGTAPPAFVGAVIAGLWRHRPARPSARAARGGRGRRRRVQRWLAHTSVDWLHNIPGVTGMALCAAAGCGPVVAPCAGPRRCRPDAIVAVGRGRGAVLAAADSVGRLASADKDRIESRDALNSDPVEALRLANRSLALNDESVPALTSRAPRTRGWGATGRARDPAGGPRTEPHDPCRGRCWAISPSAAGRSESPRSTMASRRSSIPRTP